MFTNVQIFPALATGHIIQWTLVPGIAAGFTVEIHRYDNNKWASIAKVQDTYFFVDSTFDISGGFETIYKLILNGTVEYVVNSFIGALPKKDRLYIKALRRREALLQLKGGGRPGFLLKKRLDQACSVCNGQASDLKCPICFGSGYSGGYYGPVEYNMLTVNPQADATRTTSPLGTFSSTNDSTRGLAYPIIDEGDVWVEKFTDRRFFITGKTELIFRGIPIIYTKIALSLAPPRSSVYNIDIKNTL